MLIITVPYASGNKSSTTDTEAHGAHNNVSGGCDPEGVIIQSRVTIVWVLFIFRPVVVRAINPHVTCFRKRKKQLIFAAHAKRWKFLYTIQLLECRLQMYRYLLRKDNADTEIWNSFRDKILHMICGQNKPLVNIKVSNTGFFHHFCFKCPDHITVCVRDVLTNRTYHAGTILTRRLLYFKLKMSCNSGTKSNVNSKHEI